MTNHDPEQPPGEVADQTRLLVQALLIEPENALIPLDKDHGARVVEFTVQRLNYLLFEYDKLLLPDLDAPLVFDQPHHAVETGGDWLFKLGRHQCAYDGQSDQTGSLLASYGDIYQVSISEAACQIKCLLLVRLQTIQLFQECDHVMSRLFSHFDG